MTVLRIGENPRAMPAPTVVVVKVGEEWVVHLKGTDLVRAFPTCREAVDAARVVATGADTDFVVAGDAATVIRVSELLGAKRDSNPPRGN